MTTFAFGDAVKFEDAYSGEKYGKVTSAFGGTFVVSIISKEEACTNPKRFTSRSDKRIVAVTNGTGLINN